MKAPRVENKKLFEIWTAQDNPRFVVYSDGERFIAEINAGCDWETHLSVGYSCPNGAPGERSFCLTPTPSKPGYVTWDEAGISQGRDEPVDLEPLKKAIQAAYDKLEQKDLMQMLPGLLTLAEAANRAYNDILCSSRESAPSEDPDLQG